MAALLLRKREDFPPAQLQEFSFAQPLRSKRENTLLLKLVFALTLIFIFLYISYRWFAYEFSLAKSRYTSVFAEKISSKSSFATGLFDTVMQGVTNGISTAAQGVATVSKAVETASNIVQQTSSGITSTIVKVVGDAASTVGNSATNIATGYKTVASDTIVTWSWIGGSGLLGLLLALLFIL